MKNFFDKFEKDQKLNLFVGDYLSKLTGFPRRLELADMILSDIKQSAKGYIKNRDSFSDVAQAYLDAVVSSKKTLLKQIREIFDIKHLRNVEIYNDIFAADCFQTMITMNYDVVIEKLFSSSINLSTPAKHTAGMKIRVYKILGDIYNNEDFFVTSQDIRKLKVLEFYNKFFNELCLELQSRPTIFLGVDLKDPDFTDMLNFIMKRAGELTQPVYVVSSTSVIDTKTADLINKYNIKLTVFNEQEFLEGLKSLKAEEESDEKEKKLVR